MVVVKNNILSRQKTKLRTPAGAFSNFPLKGASSRINRTDMTKKEEIEKLRFFLEKTLIKRLKNTDPYCLYKALKKINCLCDDFVRKAKG